MKDILQLEDDLTEIVQLVGRDSLGESDKITLDIAKLIKDEFLQQNGYKDYDKFCPFYKTIWMMRNFILYYNMAQQALEQAPPEMKLSWSQIAEETGDVKFRLSQMKFEAPSQGMDHNVSVFKQLHEDITNKFKQFTDSLVI